MKRQSRAGIAGVFALASALVLAGCGGDSGGDATTDSTAAAGSETGTIAFLMPDRGSTRYEQQDWPLFEAKMKELCPDCEAIYQNADADAAKQQTQAEAVIAQGADVVVIDAVDTTAAATVVQQMMDQGIKVITYDRPVPNAQADFYVSFDNVEIGRLISNDLVKHLADEGVSPDDGGVLIVNGSPADDAAMLIKEGINEGVNASDYKILAQFDTPDWLPANAQTWVEGQAAEFGNQILGIVAANDGTGGGSIAALKAAGITPLPPVTGNDAEIAAIQRIIAGDQYNTISKPIYIVAEAAAEAAFQLLKGETPEPNTTLFDTPSVLFIPEVVTIDNVKSVMIDSGIYTVEQICTDEYAAACEAAGIK